MRQLPKDDIQKKRDLVKRLQVRLNELDQLHADSEDLDCLSCDEEEEQVATNTQPQEPSGLRQRPIPQPTEPTATSTATSNRYTQPFPSDKDTNSLQSRESTLTSHEKEKDLLSASLLSLAAQLKSSAASFQSTIESEKGTVDATVEALDKSSGSMEGAGGKLKTLQRETEGAGWFRRMRIYAEVAGLWVLLVLLVFVGPKLRF